MIFDLETIKAHARRLANENKYIVYVYRLPTGEYVIQDPKRCMLPQDMINVAKVVYWARPNF